MAWDLNAKYPFIKDGIEGQATPAFSPCEPAAFAKANYFVNTLKLDVYSPTPLPLCVPDPFDSSKTITAHRARPRRVRLALAIQGDRRLAHRPRSAPARHSRLEL